MKVTALALKGAYLFEPVKHGDDRGFFSETFRASVFDAYVPGVNLVQDNHSFSRDKGTLRGLHFQTPPHMQGKLVRVPRGHVLDVLVDLRKDSPTYGQWEGVELSADNWRQLWVPTGFAHAFCTLEDNTEFVYKVSDYYSPDCDGGIAFDDPDLAIQWPFPTDQLILSEKDRFLPRLVDFDNPFNLEQCEQKAS